VYVALLGPLEVRDDTGTLIEIPGARLRALLTRLALEPGRTVGAETLIDAVWGDRPPAGAANALQTLVSRLRRVIPGRLESRPTGYRLSIVDSDVDIGRFERLVAELESLIAAHPLRERLRELHTSSTPPAPASLPTPPSRLSRQRRYAG